ncbi:MAG: DoxX family protein [Myxococcaceae bacterium]
MESMAIPKQNLVQPCGQIVDVLARARWADLSFRVLFSLIFLIAGVGHLVRPLAFVERLLHTPVGQVISGIAPAGLLIVTTGGVLLVAGVALLIGYQTRIAALTLIAVLVPITVSTHIGGGGDPGPLLKNIALLGGLIHFGALGATWYSVDCWRQRRFAHSVAKA